MKRNHLNTEHLRRFWKRKSKAPQQNPDVAPIFRLPGEIRNQIYDLLFDGFSIAVVQKRRHPHKSKLQDWCDLKKLPNPPHYDFGIRLSCRLFARETLGYLLRTINLETMVSTYWLNPVFINKEVKRFVRLFKPGLLAVQELETWYCELDPELSSREFIAYAQAFKFIFDALCAVLIPAFGTKSWPKRVPNVKSIRIRIPTGEKIPTQLYDSAYLWIFPAVQEIVVCEYESGHVIRRYDVQDGEIVLEPRQQLSEV
jgi:hypothetical protein